MKRRLRVDRGEAVADVWTWILLARGAGDRFR